MKEKTPTEPPNAYVSISGTDRVYLDFYQFKETPFSITPDPEFLFLSNTHKSVIDKILYGINSRMGFILLTGEVGTGKTTICRAILDGLSINTETVYIINPSLSGRELISCILDDLGIEYPAESTKKDLIDHLNEFLLSVSDHRPTVIIIDDAQTISLEALEDLRLLSNLETDKQKLLQMVLVGQPELLSIISSPEIRQLKQRVAITCHLDYLTKDEIEGYISRRLFIAGDKGHIRFTRKAIRLIYKASNGIPRLINKICDYALTSGYIAGHFTIDHMDVKKAITELGDLDQNEKETSFTFLHQIDFKSRKAILYFLSVFLILFMIFLSRPIYNSIVLGDLKNTPSGSGKPADTKMLKKKRQAQESAHIIKEETHDTPRVHVAAPNGFMKKQSSDISISPETDNRLIPSDLNPDQPIPDENGVVSNLQTVDDKEVSDSYRREEITGISDSQSSSFILQLGSFNTLKTAMRAVGFYTEKGIRVHWNRVDLGKKGQWYRVFTGVFKTKEALIRYRNDLNLPESMLVWTPWTVLTGQSGYCDDLEPIQSILRNHQYDSFIKKEPVRCQILSGAFVTREGAEKLAREMLSLGIAAEVATR